MAAVDLGRIFRCKNETRPSAAHTRTRTHTQTHFRQAKHNAAGKAAIPYLQTPASSDCTWSKRKGDYDDGRDSKGEWRRARERKRENREREGAGVRSEGDPKGNATIKNKKKNLIECEDSKSPPFFISHTSLPHQPPPSSPKHQCSPYLSPSAPV